MNYVILMANLKKILKHHYLSLKVQRKKLHGKNNQKYQRF